MRMVSEGERAKGDALQRSRLPDRYVRVLGFEQQLLPVSGELMVRVRPWRPSWVHASGLQGRLRLQRPLPAVEHALMNTMAANSPAHMRC